MADALDMLQCPVCGDWYVPKETATARLVPHCLPREQHVVGGRFPKLGMFVDMEV